MKRFLILTSDSGFGHRSASLSTKKAIDLLYGAEAYVEIVNPIVETKTPSVMKPVEDGYNRIVRKNPELWRFSYDLTNTRAFSEVMEGALVLALQKNIANVIRDFRPDAILNTNEMYNSPCGAALIDLDMEIPLFTVVTDLADVHTLWFSEDPAHYFLASNWVRVKACESGVPDEKISVTGIPVNPIFADQTIDRYALKQALGLKEGLPTLLFVGSQRVDNILKSLEALKGLKGMFQVVVIAGGNNALYEQLQKLSFNFPILIRNFVDNMPEWLLSADVLITKAGGLILSEGLAAGLPILIIDYIPGQEEGNIRYVLSHQAGAHVQSAGEFVATLEYWLRNGGSQLKLVVDCATRLGRPDAALSIARAMWEGASPAQE